MAQKSKPGDLFLKSMETTSTLGAPAIVTATETSRMYRLVASILVLEITAINH